MLGGIEMKCKQCNQSLAADHIFCPACGMKVDIDPVDKEFKICPQCKVEYSYSIDHCTKCGYSTPEYKEKMLMLENGQIQVEFKTSGAPKCPKCNSSAVTAGPAVYTLPTSRTINRCSACGYAWDAETGRKFGFF